MTRLCSFFGAALVSLVVAGCSGGSDVTLVPASSTSTTHSASTCEIAPGEDICGRHAELGDNAEALASLQSAATLAGEAHALLDRIFSFCEAIEKDTGIGGVTYPEAPENEKRLAGCVAVGKALEALDPSYLSVRVTPPSCAVVQEPACAQSPKVHTPPRVHCNPPSVISTAPYPESAEEKKLVGSFVVHAADLAWLDRQVRELATFFATFGSDIGRSLAAANAGDTTAASCIETTVKLVTGANDALQRLVVARTAIKVTLPLE